MSRVDGAERDEAARPPGGRVPAVNIVREATPDDIDRVVAVHMEAFGTFFLTSLGPRFLAVLYAAYLSHPSGILLVAGEAPDGGSSSIVGFVAGTTEPPGFYSWLRRSRGIALAIAAAPALVRHPRAVAERLVSAAFYRGDSSPTVGSAALLASLAVDPAASGLGLGGMLVDAFVLRAQERDRERVYLTTDAIGNERVLDFYRRLGFRETARIVRATGREMAVLVREVPDGSTDDHVRALGDPRDESRP